MDNKRRVRVRAMKKTSRWVEGKYKGKGGGSSNWGGSGKALRWKNHGSSKVRANAEEDKNVYTSGESNELGQEHIRRSRRLASRSRLRDKAGPGDAGTGDSDVENGDDDLFDEYGTKNSEFIDDFEVQAYSKLETPASITGREIEKGIQTVEKNRSKTKAPLKGLSVVEAYFGETHFTSVHNLRLLVDQNENKLIMQSVKSSPKYQYVEMQHSGIIQREMTIAERMEPNAEDYVLLKLITEPIMGKRTVVKAQPAIPGYRGGNDYHAEVLIKLDRRHENWSKRVYESISTWLSRGGQKIQQLRFSDAKAIWKRHVDCLQRVVEDSDSELTELSDSEPESKEPTIPVPKEAQRKRKHPSPETQDDQGHCATDQTHKLSLRERKRPRRASSHGRPDTAESRKLNAQSDETEVEQYLLANSRNENTSEPVAGPPSRDNRRVSELSTQDIDVVQNSARNTALPPRLLQALNSLSEEPIRTLTTLAEGMGASQAQAKQWKLKCEQLERRREEEAKQARQGEVQEVSLECW